MRLRKDWTDAEKGAVLAFLTANRGSYAQTAKQFGISRSMVWRWSKGIGSNGAVPGKQREKEAELHELFEREARAAVIAAGEIRGDAPYASLMTGAAIAVDKMRLLKDQPTLITKNEHFDGDEEAVLAAADRIRDKQRSLPSLAE